MPAPAPLKLYDRATGKAQTFESPEEATNAFASGAAAPKLTDTIPVALPDGQIGTVSGSDLASTLAAGGRIAAPQELRHAELEAKYGDGLGALGAGLAGAARGATLGLSDVALTGIAGGIGGQQGADEMRERLEAYRELHPIASTGGELAGIGATMLIPGLGEANAARGAVEGGLLARGLVGAADAATAIPRGVTALGGLAERGATRLLTEGGVTLGEGASLGERILAHGAQTAARGAAEGAVYGAGSEVSEATLGDKDLTAEQLFAGMSHGALFGGVAGGALGAAAPLARAGAERFVTLARPKLTEMAEEQAVRALSPRKAFVTEMDRIPGGQRAVGRELLDSGLIAAGDSLETLSPKITAAKNEAGDALGRILETADAAGLEGPKVAEVVKRIRAEVMPHLERMGATNKGAIEAVEKVISDFETYGGLREVPELALPKAPVAPKLEAPPKPGRLPKLANAPELADFEADVAKAQKGRAPKLELPPEPPKPELPPPPDRADFERAMAERHPYDPARGTKERWKANIKKWATPSYENAVREHAAEVGRLERAHEAVLADYEGRSAAARSKFARDTEAHAERTRSWAEAAHASALAEHEAQIAEAMSGHIDRYAQQIGEHELRGAMAEGKYAGQRVAHAEKVAELRARRAELIAQNAQRRVGFRDLQSFRAQLDDLIKWNSSPLAPVNEKTVAFKGIRNAIEGSLLDAGEKAAAARGAEFRKTYDAAKLRYRRLIVADKAATDALERASANQALSLTDKIFGAQGMTLGGLAHGPLGAAAGLATGIASKFVREHGNATAAVLLDKAAVFGAVRKQQRRVSEEIDHAVSKFFGEKGAKAPEALPASKEAPAKEYERRVQEVAAAAGDPDRAQATVLAKVSALAEHAPELRRAVAETSMRAIAYLESHIPPGRFESPSATPHLDPPAPVSTIAQQQFLDRARTVDNPATALHDFAQGRASREQIEALRAVYPQIYAQLEKGVKAKLQSATKPPPYQKILQLSSVLGQTLDRSQQPAFITSLQQADKAPPPPKLPPPPKSGALPKSFSNYQTTTQRIEGR